MKEKLQEFALIAEVVSGIAVVVTLIVLVFEIRANTEAVRIATYDSLVADLVEWRMQSNMDNEIQRVQSKRRNEGLASLNSDESELNREVTVALFQIYERAFIQWEAGNLDENQWSRFERRICGPDDPLFEETIGGVLLGVATDHFNEFREDCIR